MRGWLAKLLGNRGERWTARYLRRQGFRILDRQHRSRFGEIDLIALDGECVVFVEVKTRRSTSAGHPTEAITRTKQQQLTRAATAYLKRHHLLEHSARFDVVSLFWPVDGSKPEVTHYRNAFAPTGFGQMYS